MTVNERTKIISDLIANCDCGWTEEDRPLLNSMSDAKLSKFGEQMQTLQKAEVVANAAVEGFEDQQGNSHRFNPEKGRWESILKPTGNAKMMTEDECKNMATANALSAEDKEDLALGRSVKKERREAMIKAITSNAKNPFSADELNAMGLDQLHKLSTLAAVEEKKEDPPSRPSWMGAFTLAGNANAEANLNKSDTLETPTINWKESASVGRK